jgi:hypothetical protein
VSAAGWRLDSSTFINALAVNRVALLSRVRQPIAFVEYVFRIELAGSGARAATREAAMHEVQRGAIGIDRLTMDDLARMSALSPPRRVDIGELATAVVAERVGAGVLCDDHKAVRWLSENLLSVPVWESIEHVMLAAAESCLVAEHELSIIEQRLVEAKYACRFNIAMAYAQLWLQRQQAFSVGRAAGNEET